MRPRFAAVGLLLVSSGAARAACEITRAMPTGVLPTMAMGQTFMASAMLGSAVPGGAVVGGLATAGDVDGDDALDVLIPGGALYVQLGFATGTIPVNDLFMVPGTAGGFVRETVATIPDWTGDGGDKIVLGSSSALDASGEPTGAVYVFFSDSLFP